MTEESAMNLEVRFLLARYGRERVLKALARATRVDLSEISAAVEAYETRDKSSRKRQTPNVDALVEKLRLNPDVGAVVQKLGKEYEQGSFLPQMKEVRRFLASCGIEGVIKSRREALPKVIQGLGACDSERLDELASHSGDARGGDLGLIADQILGQKRTNSQ